MTDKQKKRNSVTPEQAKRVWDRIDALYSKLESGEATEPDMEQIDNISEIISNVTSRKSKHKVPASDEFDDLVKKDLEMLHNTLGIGHEQTSGIPSASRSSLPSSKRLSRRRGFAYIGMSIAASVLVLLGISTLINKETPNCEEELLADQLIQCCNDSVLHLSDGTTVHLAGGSDLVIANDFGRHDRTVSLTGEAFFEVAKDKTKSFIVKTREINIVVHGTSFNVTAYQEMAESKVAVRSGCVEVTREKRSFGKFHCGDHIVYDNASGQVSFGNVNPDEIDSWLSGSFSLNNATVDELKLRIRSRFHRELLIEHNAIPTDARVNYRSYKTEYSSVNTVIKSICATYGARYEINDNRIIITR